MRTISTKSSMAGAALALIIGAGVALPITRSAMASTPFDGLWSVLIVTESGDCDRGYRYPVAITNGAVRHAPEGDQSFSIAGRVARNGAVSVSVSRGEQHAEGSGRLSLSNGSGHWRSPSCAGYWEAERRG